jgi:hypothetical protein
MPNLPNREARLAELIRLGVMPAIAEEAVVWAEARGQTLPTDAELAADFAADFAAEANSAANFAADIERARMWWLWQPAVGSEWKRLLSARAVGAPKMAANQPRVPAGSPDGGQFVATPGSGGAPRLSHHAFERMRERGKYAGVKDALRQLAGKPTPEGDWFCPMARKGKLDGYLVGADGVVKTVLGPWYDPAKLRGLEVALAKMAETSRLDIRRSIQWQLDNLTPAMAVLVCGYAGLPAMPDAELRATWQDWTADGLERLLIARSEVEDAEPT